MNLNLPQFRISHTALDCFWGQQIYPWTGCWSVSVSCCSLINRGWWGRLWARGYSRLGLLHGSSPTYMRCERQWMPVTRSQSMETSRSISQPLIQPVSTYKAARLHKGPYFSANAFECASFQGSRLKVQAEMNAA